MNAEMPLSVIVIGYNMARELPRTIRSLSPALQRGIAAQDYEIIVVDNGSTTPPTDDEVESWAANARLIVVEDATVSPVPAINSALDEARGRLVGVLIDGARMASPGLLASALEASGLHDRPVIGTLAFHLGPDVQMRSVLAGYDQVEEDRLLEGVCWEEDPYRLFDIAVFAGSSERGWFIVPAETNALFLTREHWRTLGGYDERFVTPGGGLVNLDMWKRACEDPDGKVMLLLGEATFHQVHGGIATNNTVSPWQLFHDEYIAIRGTDYVQPQMEPLIIGRPHPRALATVKQSLARLMSEAGGFQRDPVARPVRATGKLRTFDSSIPSPIFDAMQHGVMHTMYRGVRCLKNPFDIGLYMQLIGQLRPRTVIEVGCRFGGSALWFADMMSSHDIPNPRVIALDIAPEVGFADPRILVIKGDAAALGDSLTDALLADCPRPWLVVEDSSHFYQHSIATLEFFHSRLASGDYIVVEDGVVTHLSNEHYRQYQNGPNRAVADFLSREGASYTIDTDLCDFYGRNATYCPNGWLRRI